MDLKFSGAEPLAEERDAVDRLLGSGESGWHGGERDEQDHRRAHTGHAVRAQRHLVMETLHAVNDRVGWISPRPCTPQARYACSSSTLTMPSSRTLRTASSTMNSSSAGRWPNTCDPQIARCAPRSSGVRGTPKRSRYAGLAQVTRSSAPSRRATSDESGSAPSRTLQSIASPMRSPARPATASISSRSGCRV